MQIDDRSYPNWIKTNEWASPIVNIRKACMVLLEKRVYLDARLGLSEDDLLYASIAAYNAGQGNVLRAIRSGKGPDSVTAHGNYAAEVMRLSKRYKEIMSEE